ncbi:hypothetical protein KC887_05725 [Candidatus Kaiserbacteria bacterium]|nr:hypothetical protein [Candidatus Kaiserbacteria bacterium]
MSTATERLILTGANADKNVPEGMTRVIIFDHFDEDFGHLDFDDEAVAIKYAKENSTPGYDDKTGASCTVVNDQGVTIWRKD